mgnify:CR=1 FL=1
MQVRTLPAQYVRQSGIFSWNDCLALMSYTERHLTCTTLRADLLDLAEAARWDVVLVNYTLQYVAASERPAALKHLASALVPGGTLICVAKTGTLLSPSQAAESQSAWLDKARPGRAWSGMARQGENSNG